MLSDKPLPALTAKELQQYRRQIMIPGFGEEGQRKLKAASALVTRVGGLGGPAALMLAAAGIGKLVIAHGGLLELSNMNRQILMAYQDLGKPRINSAAETLRRFNPDMELIAIGEDTTENNVEKLVSQADIVLACPPTFEERYLLNRECVRQRKPLINAAMYGLECHLTTILPGESACFACIYPETPSWQIPFPVIGAVSAALGCLAAIEAIKVITGLGKPLVNTLLVLDTGTMVSKKLPLYRQRGCQVCGSL